ncbi:conjugal transfer protein [Salmonella enterica]|nr:conjugal transfer protein [Salmonella enterica]
MKKLLLLSIFLLGACSSPPEAPKVDWDKKEDVMNTQLMAWSSTDHVLKSDVVNGHWQQKITGFVPENRFYNDAVFYAVAHSKRVVVETSGSTDFFNAKAWLRKNGAEGVIEYRSNKPCVMCTTTLYLEK